MKKNLQSLADILGEVVICITPCLPICFTENVFPSSDLKNWRH